MKVTFPFLNKLLKDKPVVIVNIISIDNSKQTGKPIQLAIKELEESVDRGIVKIAELITIDTTFLNRFYDKSKAIKTGNTAWFRANEQYLTSSKFSVTCFPWYKIQEFEEYSKWRELLKTAYEGDESGECLDKEWRERVNRLSKQHIHKGTLKGRIQYLLEESVGYITLLEHLLKDKKYRGKSILITYAGKLNECLTYIQKRYIYDKYKSSFPNLDKEAYFFPYKVKGELEVLNPARLELNNVFSFNQKCNSNLIRRHSYGKNLSGFGYFIGRKMEEIASNLDGDKKFLFYMELEQFSKQIIKYLIEEKCKKDEGKIRYNSF